MTFGSASVVTETYTPHRGQAAFHDWNARVKFLSAGTRFGKDRACVHEFIKRFGEMLGEERASDMVPKVRGLVLAPSFPLMRQLWREVKHFFPAEWVERVYESERIIITKGDGLVQVRFAEEWQAVDGGYDIVLASECARMDDFATLWNRMNVATLSPRGPNGGGGLLLLNSTPRKGSEWNALVLRFKDMEATHRRYHGVGVFTMSSYDNPMLNTAELDRLREMLPEHIFREEVMGELL